MELATLYMMVAYQAQPEHLWQPRSFATVGACEEFVTKIRRTAPVNYIVRYECKIDWPMENEPPPYWTLPPRNIVIAK